MSWLGCFEACFDRVSQQVEGNLKRTRSTLLDCKTFLRDNTGPATDFYKKVGDLGEGAFGDVWLARERVHAGTDEEYEGRYVAVKRVRKPNPGAGLDEHGADSEEAKKELRVEVDLMKSLDHPTICKLLQVCEDAKNLYIVMEHIDGCELFERISDDEGSFTERDAAEIIGQVASALMFCHRRGVVHRDIKPENVMVINEPLNDGPAVSVKLIDFGFGCRILDGVKLKPRVGSLVYTAPEVVKGDLCDEKQADRADECVLFPTFDGHAKSVKYDCGT
eukprot:TRINITY_DN6473_c0_g1_i7.p2 TRINITY_DN6473_c0_g1~~TRINITY_DN6473_c0_g1_i7.p2  ORF type:complete len:307 (+),score=79.02 TRINITY_DN6473_c0_g1_i7:91-921(+)